MGLTSTQILVKIRENKISLALELKFEMNYMMNRKIREINDKNDTVWKSTIPRNHAQKYFVKSTLQASITSSVKMLIRFDGKMLIFP